MAEAQEDAVDAESSMDIEDNDMVQVQLETSGNDDSMNSQISEIADSSICSTSEPHRIKLSVSTVMRFLHGNV